MSDIPPVTEPGPNAPPSGNGGRPAPAVQTADEARITSLTPQKGLEVGKILTQIPKDKEGKPKERVDLGAELDEQAYKRLETIQSFIAAVAKDNPADPNIPRLQMMVNKLLGDENSGFRKRAQAINEEREKLRKSRRYNAKTDTMRYFHTEEELVLALGAIDVDQLLTAESFGQKITNFGKKPFEVQIPEIESFVQDLEARVPGVPRKTWEALKEAFKKENYKDAKKLIGLIAGSSPGVALGSIGGAAVGGSVGAILGAAAGTAIGAGIGWNYDIFVTKERKVTIRIDCPKTASRVITSYARHSGRLGDDPGTIGAGILEGEKLRHDIYLAVGLNTGDPNQRAMINLDLEALDPASNTVSQGVGRVRFNTERQLALATILDSMGVRSLAELSPEQRLEVILRSYDAAAGKMCEGVATQVISELTAQGQRDRTSQATALTTAATELEQGKRTLTPVDQATIDAKKAAKLQAEQQSQLLDEQKAELDTISKEIPTKEDALRTATSAREAKRKRYETPPSSGGDTLLVRLEHEASSHFTTYKKLVSDVADLDRQIRGDTEQLGNKQKRLTQLRDQYIPYVETLTENDINPFTRVKFADKVELTNLLNQLQTEGQNLETEISVLGTRITANTETKHTKDAELAEAKSQHQESKEAFRTAQRELDDTQAALDAAKNNFDAAVARRDQILKDYFGWSGSGDRPKPGEIIKTVSDAKQQVTGLTAEITKLEADLANFKGGTGEATAEDKETAKALKLVAGLLQEAKYNGVMGRLWEGKDSVAELRSHDQWIQLFFGPLMGEDRAIAERVLTRALMVETAVEVFGLNPQEFFGADYAALRQNYREMESQVGEIGNLRAARGIDWQKNVKTRQEALTKAAQANYALLEQYFDRITPLITRNRIESVEYAGVLVDRIRDHAISENVFGLSYGIRERETGVRKMGETAETPSGRIRVEPPQVVNGVEQNHGSVVWETLPHQKTANDYEFHATVKTNIMKPESVGALNALRTTLSVRLSPDLWNALPPTRPVAGWPPQLLAAFYNAAGGKKPQEEVEMGKDVAFPLDKKDFLEVQGQLNAYRELGALGDYLLRSTGQMVIAMDERERERYFGKFASININLKAVSGTSIDMFTVNRGLAGKILVSSTGGVKDAPLSEFINRFENYYKRRMRISTPLNAVQRDEMQQFLDQILVGIGQEALQSLQRY